MNTSKRYVEWLLRIGVFGTFLGHGIFALQVKQSFIPLITAFGFTEATATALLPWIGMMDLLVAVIVLFRPIKAILIWATVWAFATALSRPIAGMPIWDFVERTANWIVPLTLLHMHGLPKKLKDILKV